MIGALWEGWLLGLSSGAACLGLCAPLLLPWLVVQGPQPWGQRWWQLGEFLAGRLTAYLLCGLAVAAVGQRFAGSPGLARFSGLLTLALAVLLAVHAVRHSFPEWRPCAALCGRPAWRRVPLLAGLLLGLSPCPPLLLALARLLGDGRPAEAVALLLALFAGTTVWLLPLLGASSLGRREHLRGLSEVAMLLSALWFGLRGAAALLGGN
ncbi:MAG: sulfite exporter TauE/SafE family protein [Fimbriimonadaceae bacterium]|nr:sulfite exporter TauE/SafE family protein [Fimbriimonadaceae bacterium]